MWFSMKRAVLGVMMVFCFVVTLIAGSSCEKSPPTPEKVLSEYFQYLQDGNFTAAYEMLTESDRAAKNYSDYEEIESWGRAMQIRYEIQSAITVGNESSITVNKTGPDLTTVFAEVMSAAFDVTSDGEDASDSNNPLEDINTEDLPMRTVSEVYKLHTEAEIWKIYLGFEVAALLEEAEAYRNQANLNQASQRIEAALAIEPDNQIAKAKLGEVIQGQKKGALQMEYLQNHIHLENFVFERRDTWSKNNVPVISGKIRNSGDRIVTRVVMKTYFLDDAGVAIGEDTYTPVNMYSDSPLKPNYVEDFAHSLDDSAPSGWDGKVRVELTSIEFQDD